MTASNETLTLAKEARRGARSLAASSLTERNQILTRYAQLLEENADRIFAANAEDMAAESDENLLKRLKFDQSKLQDVLSGLKALIAMADPLSRVDLRTKLDTGLVLERVSCAIGVLAVIFEARPDALPQIAALSIKSGNAALLKGGKEARRTNQVLFELLKESLGTFADCFHLLSGREAVEALLKARGDVDLIIPRGSGSLVSYIQSNTQIPVLGHAEGVCHIYIDAGADSAKSLDVVLDAKVSYPAACNAVETLLVHEEFDRGHLQSIFERLLAEKVELRVCPELVKRFAGTELSGKLVKAKPTDFGTEFSARILACKQVCSLDEAIDHINKYGSGHTDAILTGNDDHWRRFFSLVDSAGVYRNCSTRFADGFRYGFGAEVGISTGRLPPRGPVGLDGLLTYKYRLSGDGHTTAVYGHSKKFLHENLLSDRFEREWQL
ncbi:MAG: glutamate-5-semialdehyde dehydrogenase [Candidatus Melainabacteria bacterium]|nr:glutamate-5-semialdehyde dehydrogenase [Candidatus Melainabacteria bacterium]